MAEVKFKNIKLVDREEILEKFREKLGEVISGGGKTVFLSGEAGIGKTRIVEEGISHAEEMGFKIVRGECLPEKLEPFFPFKNAFRKADLDYILSEKPLPLVLSVYLISSESGLLITKSERKETNLDPDIFVGMLKAIEAFVRDSMNIMEREGGATLNSLSYGDYTILIQSSSLLSLSVVIKGEQNRFLREDMIRILDECEVIFKGWGGEGNIEELLKPKIEWFLTSEKYDGRYAGALGVVQENIFDMLVEKLKRVSEKYPLLIFIDDLQWADQTSLNFIYYLSKNIRNEKMMIIGTYRPEEMIPASGGKLHPLEITINNLAKDNLVRIISLRRLTKKYTMELIEAILGDFDISIGNKIYHESGGNPFFVIEIIKLLISEKVIYREDGKWKLKVDAEKLAIPKRAYELIKRRLERLNDEEREILDVASVIGEEFDVKLLSRVIGMDELKILRKLNRIYRKHKLIYERGGKYRFEHSIIREVLYNELLEDLRREYHRIIGDAIFQLNENNVEGIVNLLAYHYYEAGDKKAVKYLLQMGNKARKNYALNEAMVFYRRALKIGEKTEFKGEILESIGDIMVMRGDYKDAIRNYQDSMLMGKKNGSLSRLNRKIAEAHVYLGNYNKALELLQEAKKSTKEFSVERGRIYGDMGKIYFLTGNHEVAVEMFKNSLKIFGKNEENKGDIARILKMVGDVDFFQGNYEKAKRYYREALQIMRKEKNMEDVILALMGMGNLSVISGNYDRALNTYFSVLKLIENMGLNSFYPDILKCIGDAYFEKGDIGESLKFYNDAMEVSEKMGRKRELGILLNDIGYIYYLKGKFDNSMNYFARSLKIAKEIGDKNTTAHVFLGIADIYLHKGKIQEAYKLVKNAILILKQTGDNVGLIKSLLAQGHLLGIMGEYGRGIKNVEKAMEIANKTGLKNFEIIGNRILGMIYIERMDFGKSMIELTRALRYFSSRNRFQYARTVYEYALLLGKINEREKAKKIMEEAKEIFHSLGISLWEEKSSERIEKLGTY